MFQWNLDTLNSPYERFMIYADIYMLPEVFYSRNNHVEFFFIILCLFFGSLTWLH